MTDLEKKRRYWLIGIACSVMLGFGLMLTLGIGALQMFVLAPWNTYDSVNSEEWRALNVRTMTFASVRDFQVAERALQETLPKAQKEYNPIPSYLLGSLYQVTHRNRQAIQQYQETIRLVDKSPLDWYADVLYQYFVDDARSELALLYYQNHQPKRSLAQLLQIKDFDGQSDPELLESLMNSLEDPDRADYHYQLALQLRHRLKLPEAKNEFEQAVALSTDPELRFKAQSYLATKMPKALHSISPLSIYFSMAGDIHEAEQVDLRRAADYYEQAIQESPDFEWPYYHLALVYQQLEDNDHAVEYAEKALKLNPNFALPYMTLGEVALDRQDYTNAVTYYNKALALGGSLDAEEDKTTLANVENQLGYAYEQMQKQMFALNHYQKVLELAEENSEDYSYAETAIQRIKTEGKKRLTSAKF